MKGMHQSSAYAWTAQPMADVRTGSTRKAASMSPLTPRHVCDLVPRRDVIEAAEMWWRQSRPAQLGRREDVARRLTACRR